MENFLPPFLTRIQEYSIYAKVQIQGHREYNTIEVMGLEDESGKMLIHAIISLHDRSGLRFINDRDVVTNIKIETPARKAFYSPIELEHTITADYRRINVRIYTEKNEEIILSLNGGKSAYYPQSLMSQPTGFINHHELPIGFSFKLRKILQNSYMHINRREYKITPINQFLGFQYGPLGRMAENYVRLNLYIPPERLHCTHSPDTYTPGQGWSYTAGNRILSYEIEAVDDKEMIVTRRDESHRIMLIDGKMHLSQTSFVGEEMQHVDINFIPPFPIAPHGEKISSRISIVSDSVPVYEASLTIAPLKDQDGNSVTLIGDRKYHSADDDMGYIISHEGNWVINEIDPSIL